MKISEVTKNATITKDYSNVSFYHIGIPILCVTALLSLLLNFYILLSVKWISRKITPNLQITLSLAAVDSLTAALFITGYLLNSYLPIVFGLPMPTLNCFRLFLETLRVGAAITSVIHVLFLSMNQLISILYPLTYRTIITKRRIILLLIPGWICPFLCLNFIFISYPGQGYRSNTCFSRFLVEFKYRITIFLIVMIPFTAIVVTHVILVFLLRQMKSLQLTAKPKVRKSNKAATTTLSIIITFALGWLPGSLLLVVLCHDCIVDIRNVPSRILIPLATVSNGLIVVKLVLNPIIYAFRIREIRYALWLMNKQKFGLSKTPHFHHDIPSEFLKLTDSSHAILYSRRNSPAMNSQQGTHSPRLSSSPMHFGSKLNVEGAYRATT